MKRKILIFLLLAISIFGLVKLYHLCQWKQEEKRRAAYYENLVDTSSPTVSKDSVLMEYKNEMKVIHIYVPPEYNSDTTTHYPVIYILDGESSFNDLENMGPEWQIDEVINAAAAARKQTAIVIGINEAEDRDAEYTPFVNGDNPNAHGDKFATWVSYDLKSFVDNKFRTQKEADATTIGGISRSGMMAYYMLMAHPDIFGKALIQSPSMWVDHDRLLDMQIEDSQLKDKKVFISVGAYEGNVMIPHAKDVYEKFKALGMHEDNLRLEIIPDEGHWHITWRKSFALAYPWLMK